MCDELLPVFLLGIGDRRGDEPVVAATGVRTDVEEVASVLDVVLVLVLARCTSAWDLGLALHRFTRTSLVVRLTLETTKNALLRVRRTSRSNNLVFFFMTRSTASGRIVFVRRS